jgi:hypothetical protein
LFVLDEVGKVEMLVGRCWMKMVSTPPLLLLLLLLVSPLFTAVTVVAFLFGGVLPLEEEELREDVLFKMTGTGPASAPGADCESAAERFCGAGLAVAGGDD